MSVAAATKRTCPLGRNVGTILSLKTHVCAGIAIPALKRVHVAAVANSHDGSAVCQHSFSRRVLKRKVCGIQFARTRSVCAGSLRSHSNRRAGSGLLGYRREIRVVVIVRVLDHVNDLIVYLRRIPLGVERRVLFQGKGAACSLGARSIRIPAIESVASAGCRRRKGNLSAIRRSHGLNVLAAFDVIGESEVTTGVVDLQLLAGITGKSDVLVTPSIVGIGIALDFGGNLSVLDANCIIGLNQLVLVSRERLKVVTDLVLSIGGHVLIFNLKSVGAIALPGELVLGYSDGRLARIVRRLVCNLRRNRKARSGYGIAVFEVALGELVNLLANRNLVAAIHVVVVNGELVSTNVLEDGYRIEALGDGISVLDGIAVGLVLPVVEDLAFKERVLGHGRDLVAHSEVNEVLRLLSNNLAAVILDEELDRNLILEVGI